MQKCKTCQGGGPFPLNGMGGYRPVCCTCHNETRRLARLTPEAKKKNSDYGKKYRETRKEMGQAHWSVRHAVSKDSLSKAACTVCGNEKSEAHHSDYNKPLDVTWLCRKHHSAWHRVFIADV